MEKWLIRIGFLAVLFFAGRWAIQTVSGWIDEQHRIREGMARHVAEQEAAAYSAALDSAQALRAEQMRVRLEEVRGSAQ